MLVVLVLGPWPLDTSPGPWAVTLYCLVLELGTCFNQFTSWAQWLYSVFRQPELLLLLPLQLPFVFPNPVSSHCGLEEEEFRDTA